MISLSLRENGEAVHPKRVTRVNRESIRVELKKSVLM